MKPKAITFFDLDGTLLNEHSKITTEVRQALDQLKANQVLPVIATGRTNIEIKEIAKASGIETFITMNGQYIEQKGQEIFQRIIPQEVVARLKSAVYNRGHELGFYTSKEIFVTQHTPTLIRAYEVIHSQVPPVDPNFYLKSPLNMLLVLSQDGDEFYRENFPELKFFRNGPDSIDTISADGSKGFGVKKFLEVAGYEDVPTFGFGDGPNDVELLEACQTKIAMGNATNELKELADFVTTKNTEGGIVNALKNFQLLP